MGFFDGLMSPLGKEHCIVFYYIGYFFLALVLLAFMGILKGLYKKNYKLTGLAIFCSIMYVFMYYIYRVVYSICLVALK